MRKAREKFLVCTKLINIERREEMFMKSLSASVLKSIKMRFCSSSSSYCILPHAYVHLTTHHQLTTDDEKRVEKKAAITLRLWMLFIEAWWTEKRKIGGKFANFLFWWVLSGEWIIWRLGGVGCLEKYFVAKNMINCLLNWGLEIVGKI